MAIKHTDATTPAEASELARVEIEGSRLRFPDFERLVLGHLNQARTTKTGNVVILNRGSQHHTHQPRARVGRTRGVAGA